MASRAPACFGKYLVRWAAWSLSPRATAEHLREMMAACGVRPEDNLFSRHIHESLASLPVLGKSATLWRVQPVQGYLEVVQPLEWRQFLLAVKRLADSLSYGTDRSPFL